MRTITCKVDDGLTAVGDEWGDPTNPPLLMLHGAGQNRHAWKYTAGRLADEGWFVLTMDARGHGDSDWSATQSYDMDDTGADVLRLLERFDQPVVVVGASMGGMACLAAQRLAGEQLYRAVVLVDITPKFAIGGAKRILEFMSANPNGFADLEEAADAMAAYNPHRPRPKNTDGLKKVLRQSDDGRWHWRWDPSYISSKPGFADEDDEVLESRMHEMGEQMMSTARSLTVPTLLVRGGQSDLVTPEAVEAFLVAVPHAEFVDVAGTGHMVAGDDNDAFTMTVLGFVNQLD